MKRKEVESTVISDPEHRYALAAQKLEPGMSVLDVGGYNERRQLIANVLGNDFQYTAVNTSKAWYPDSRNFIPYDGCKLPFADKAFNYAISVDTLEHIVPEQRAMFVQEMIRVGQKVVLIVPFSDASRPDLEPLFVKLSAMLGVELKSSARDHIEKGLPTLNEINNYFENHPYEIEFGTDYINLWKMCFGQLFVNALVPNRSKYLNKRINDFFLPRLVSERSNLKKRSYRVIVST